MCDNRKAQVGWTVCGVALLAGHGTLVWMQGDFEGLTGKSVESFGSSLLLPCPRIFEGKPISAVSGTLLLKRLEEYWFSDITSACSL